MGESPPRPQTHELLASIIEQLGHRLDRIVINDLKNHTFYARLYLVSESGPDAETVEVDSRPSDAIALGVATDVPVFVEDHVLDEVCRSD